MDKLLLTDWPELFPNPENAPASGLLAAGGDLLPQTLLTAYAHGIFPWYGEGDPILWWSPDPRCALWLDQFRISRRSQRKIRHSNFTCSCDTAFGAVISACAARSEGTWLLPEMQAAYLRLHELGYAHSVEIWQEQKLVGGVYGLALGQVFFGESMFRRASEASRAALCGLVALLRQKDFRLLDCQQASPHMLAMGACQLPRAVFLRNLRELAGGPNQLHGKWQLAFGDFFPPCAAKTAEIQGDSK